MSKRLVKKIEFTEADEAKFGMFMLSRVADPAIEENFVWFSKTVNTNFSIQNEEHRIIFGPVLVPDMLIYRNQGGEEYDLTVDAPTIERIAVNFFKNNRANNVNDEHAPQIEKGFTIFQSIITGDLVPTVKGYEHLPVGTLFMGAKVTDDNAWQEIKDGKFKGWSIHAAFRQVPVELMKHDDKEVEKLADKFFATFQ